MSKIDTHCQFRKRESKERKSTVTTMSRLIFLASFSEDTNIKNIQLEELRNRFGF